MATSPMSFIPTPSHAVHIEQIEDLLKLQKAAQKITSILDLDCLIDEIVNHIALSFGCLETNIYLHDKDHAEMVLAAVCGCTCSEKGHRLKIGKEGIVGHVAATSQIHYAPDVRNDPYYIGCEKSTLSEVAIPLLVEGELVGVFVASHPEVEAFPPGQLRLLQSLCSHVAVAVHNARRFEQEQQERKKMSFEAEEARVIQQALLPKNSPHIPGFSISGLSIPAGAVGGDWYDFIELGDGRWGVVLADVSGKGTAAALLMSATRGMLRSLAEAHCCPAEVLSKLNRLMVQDFPPGKFVTMVYAVLDPSSRTLTFANAGHLRPLLVQGDDAHFLDTQHGLPLGITCGEFSETQVHLPEGSRLLFYSDGITEATGLDDQEYGATRLQQHAAITGASPESILEDVRSFANGEGLCDDATVIFVKA